MGNGLVRWYRVSFTTKRDKVREWEIFLAATTADKAKNTARYLWEKRGCTSRMLYVKARLIKGSDDVTETYTFKWLNLPKQEEII